MALSGLSDADIARAASGRKTDMPNEHVECPLGDPTRTLLRHRGAVVQCPLPDPFRTASPAYVGEKCNSVPCHAFIGL